MDNPFEMFLRGLGIARKAVWSTAEMNDLPDSAFLYVAPGGSKDADGKTTPRSLRHWPYKDAAGKVDLAHVRDALSRIPQTKGVPDSVKAEARARAEKLLGNGGSEEKAKAVPGALSVAKQADGRYRWTLLSSNSYRDDAKEIVAQKALEVDVARADADHDYGPLLWWHLDGHKDRHGNAQPVVRLGSCDFNAMHGHVLVESGLFDDPNVAQAFKDKADQLQVSIAFFYPFNEPDQDGVIHHIRRYERSLLPAGAAANPLTGVPVITQEGQTMQAEKLKQLEDLVGKEGAAAALQAAEAAEQKAIAEKRAQKDAGAADDDADDAKCPNCGAMNAADAKTCAKCGKPMAAGQKELDPEQAQAALKELIGTAVKDALAEVQQASQKALEPIQAELKQAREADAHILEQLKTTGDTLAAVQTAQKASAAKLEALAGDLPRSVARAFDATKGDNQVLTTEQLEEMKQKGIIPHEDQNVKDFDNFLSFAISGKAPAR